MKKFVFIMVFLSFSILVVACSNDSSSNESSDKAAISTKEAIQDSSDFSTGAGESTTDDQDKSQGEKTEPEKDISIKVNRKIIYTANLIIEVKNFQHTLNDIQTQVSNHGGYIVESSMYDESEEESTSGQITARIPQDQFREFMDLVEKGSIEVLESSISGQDVTEEYIDLESRLKSKHVVEKRLLSFMEQAEKTEDLLTISEDLAKVQGEIEEITGKMKYLQNKADLATVTVHIQENNVIISKDLNTWEKVKDQFMKSINFLITAFSGVAIFLIGSLPILIVLGLIGLVVFLIIRKRRRDS